MNKNIVAVCAILAVFGAIFASTICAHADENVSEAFERTLGSQADLNDMGLSASDPAIIEIAPGYSWTYEPEFPSDLKDHITLSIITDSDGIIDFTDSSKKTVRAVIPSNAVPGTVYNIELKATMTEPVQQTRSQFIRLTVIDGLGVSGSIENIVLGDTIDFTPSGSSGMGNVVWKVKNGTQLPDGLTLSNGKVTGKPTSIGTKTVSLTATANGESKDLVASFTVFSKICGDSDETVKAFGASASSRTIGNPSDISVRWTALDTLPEGFSLDGGTGAVSGYSAEPVKTTVRISGSATATGCPEQTVVKSITVMSEKKLELSVQGSILTYLHNPSDVSASVNATQTSRIQWSENCDFADIDSGIVTVRNPTVAGMNQIIRITATTEYGQTASASMSLKVENTLEIDGEKKLNAIVGIQKSIGFTVSGGSGNSLAASCPNAAVNTTVAGSTLSVTSSDAVKNAVVTVTVTSEAGQTATLKISLDVYSQLSFTSAPTGGAIAFAM